MDMGWTRRKHRRSTSNRPFVYVDPIPNENNLLDCYVMGAPGLTEVSIVGMWKDVRQLEEVDEDYDEDFDSMSAAQNDVIKRLTEKYMRYQTIPQKPNQGTNMT